MNPISKPPARPDDAVPAALSGLLPPEAYLGAGLRGAAGAAPSSPAPASSAASQRMPQVPRELYMDGVARLVVRAGVAKLDLYQAEPVTGPDGAQAEQRSLGLRLIMPAAALAELLQMLRPDTAPPPPAKAEPKPAT